MVDKVVFSLASNIWLQLQIRRNQLCWQRDRMHLRVATINEYSRMIALAGKRITLKYLNDCYTEFIQRNVTSKDIC